MDEHLRALTAASHHAYAKRGPVKKGMWRGVRAIKYPTDLMLYAEIIFEQKPDLIVETGTRFGGAALFLADMCRLANHGKVVSVEISDDFGKVTHPRLTCLRGSSTAPEIVNAIYSMRGEKALVILDSDHSARHVLEEMKVYADLVHVGGYLIAEDTRQELPEGPAKAVERFLKQDSRFVLDRAVEKYGIHNAHDGFLRRIA